ncbi:MAG: hypothetical protein RI575_11105 [Balneolaceae bacterium]|nr:hypothetical protein [Balneolaceae bacterium]MDR9410608.1 hypothetical protein [Balneolaceae bacterium]
MVKKKIRVNGLLKIGKGEHITDLQKNGTIYCNTIKSFREFETQDLNRRDEREGAYKTEYLDPSKLKLLIDGKELPVKFTSARLNLFDNSIQNHKLYCLYGFKPEYAHGDPFIDEQNCRFGNKALLIKDTYEFIIRVKEKLRDLDLDFQYDWVNYYTEGEINESLSVFHKPDDFKHQSEFRFYIKHEALKPLKFSIGSIEDISMIVETKKLPKLSLTPIEEVS